VAYKGVAMWPLFHLIHVLIHLWVYMEPKEQENQKFIEKYKKYIEDYIIKYLESRNSDSNSNNEILIRKSRIYLLENLKSNDKNFDEKFKQILEDKLLDFFIEYIQENTNYKINKVEFYYTDQSMGYQADIFSFKTC